MVCILHLNNYDFKFIANCYENIMIIKWTGVFLGLLLSIVLMLIGRFRLLHAGMNSDLRDRFNGKV